jgi:hypothetical protein
MMGGEGRSVPHYTTIETKSYRSGQLALDDSLLDVVYNTGPDRYRNKRTPNKKSDVIAEPKTTATHQATISDYLPFDD